MRNFLLLISSIFIFGSCGSDEDVSGVNPEGDARYRLTFQGDWTEADHGSLPDNAHFTTFIGMTHGAAVHLFMLGGNASPGVEDVAERGKVERASAEIDARIDAGTAFSKPVIGVSDGPVGNGTGEFTVSEAMPYLSIISMIAPSPDWFVGLRSFNLFDGGVWLADTTIDVRMYDCGTEDGDQFSGDNPDTDPRGTIQMLDETNASVLANGTPGIVPIGNIRIQRID